MSSKIVLLICATSLTVAAPAFAQYRDGDRPDHPRREQGGARPAAAPAQGAPARSPVAPTPQGAPAQNAPARPAWGSPPAYTPSTPPPNSPRYGVENRSWQPPAAPAQRPTPPASQPPAFSSNNRPAGGGNDLSRGGDRNVGDRGVVDRRGGDRGDSDRRGGDRGWGDRGWGDRGWGDHGGGNWDRDERNRRGDGDRGWSYRGEDHSRFRVPPYRYPYNWGYRSWRVGERLPYLFLSDSYYIDFGPYGLPRPPYGYRWVRFGPDVLLVNVYTGEIVDVVYDIFY